MSLLLIELISQLAKPFYILASLLCSAIAFPSYSEVQ
jgi:hypothetical protein